MKIVEKNKIDPTVVLTQNKYLLCSHTHTWRHHSVCVCTGESSGHPQSPARRVPLDWQLSLTQAWEQLHADKSRSPRRKLNSGGHQFSRRALGRQTRASINVKDISLIYDGGRRAVHSALRIWDKRTQNTERNPNIQNQNCRDTEITFSIFIQVNRTVLSFVKKTHSK